MTSLRKRFLDSYLGALGAAEILNYEETPTTASGTLRYAPDPERPDLSGDLDYLEDFRWDATDADVPDEAAMQILDLINLRMLLDIDTLRLSRTELYTFMHAETDQPMERLVFEQALSELEDVRVAIIEDGEEVDHFAIHA